MRSKSVFLSYARAESSRHVRNLARALADRGIDAFLDTSDISVGDQFLRPMIDALLASRVVVIFLGPVYFTRPGCLRELEVAQAVHDLELAADRDANKRGPLRHLIAVLPPNGSLDLMYERLAWTQAQTAWTVADNTERLAKLVEDRLSEVKKSIRSHLSEVDAAYVREYAVRIPAVSGALDGWDANEHRWYHPNGARPVSIGDGFLGRGDELFRLRNLLAPRRQQAVEPIGVVVSGSPGAGKTRLVEEYISHFGHEWSGVFWIDASSDALGLGRQQYEVGLRLMQLVHGDTITIPTMADLEANRRSLIDFFAEALDQLPPTLSVLIILDNIPEGGTRNRSFRPETYCPRLGSVALIITRRQRWNSPGFESIVVKELVATAAVTLLIHGLARRGVLEYGEWEAIADWVGYLPLALRLLNAAMASNDDDGGRSTSTAADDHDAQAPRPLRRMDRLEPRALLAHIRRPAAEPGPTHEPLSRQLPRKLVGPLLDTFALSFDRLDPETQAGATLLAYFGPSNIPSPAVDALTRRPSTICLDALHQRHFLRDATATTEGSMHRLLGEYLRSRANSPRLAIEVCFALMNVHTRNLPTYPTNWPLLNICFEHVRSVVNWRPAGDVDPPDGLDAMLRQQVRTGSGYVMLLEAQGRISDALAWAQEMYRRSMEVPGPPDPFSVLLAAQLADLHRAVGEHAAATTVASNTLTATQAATGSSTLTTTLAVITAADHRNADCASDYQRALKSMPRVIQLMTRSMEALGRAATEPAVAIATHQELIAESVADNGTHALVTLMLKEQYALTLAKFDIASALALQQEIVSVKRSNFALDPLQLSSSLLTLGSIYARAGDLMCARSAQEESVRIRRRAFKKGHPQTLRAMSDLAFTVAMQNDHGRANRLYADVVSTGSRALGQVNPLTLEWIRWQAWELTRSGDIAKAIATRRGAIHNAESCLGVNHGAVIELKEDLLKDLARQEAYAEAYQVALALVDNARAIHGEQSKDALLAMEAAANHGLRANAAGAADMLRDVYTLGLRLFGPQHRGVQQIKMRLETLNA